LQQSIFAPTPLLWFELSNRTTEDYVTLVSLDPFYNVRFEDGSVFHYNGSSDYVTFSDLAISGTWLLSSGQSYLFWTVYSIG
jgi:hypothetical protein